MTKDKIDITSSIIALIVCLSVSVWAYEFDDNVRNEYFTELENKSLEISELKEKIEMQRRVFKFREMEKCTTIGR